MIRNKTFLKWAGNKSRCLPHIAPHLTKSSCLIEPFAGSAAVFLHTEYPRYILAENNQDLITLFHTLQREGSSFIDYCESWFTPANNNKEKYYLLRQEFNQSTDTRVRSALFVYLNRHGYNGLCRYNQQNIYNVPFGRYLKPHFPREEMLFFHQKAQDALIVHQDFQETLTQAQPGDVIYCDPPYVPIVQKTNFSTYTHQKFGEEEQMKLAELAIQCAHRNITVIISNHDTEFTRHHYASAELHSFEVRRSISCQAAHRAAVRELVAVFR